MLNYVSLIIDVENSRGYGLMQRNDMQKFMIDCMDGLNQAFDKSLEFKMIFSAGDEIQGLFRNMTAAVLYMRIFEMMIKPVKIRAGIGVGEWNVKIENGVSTQQDGPVYHRARKAIEEVRKKQTQRYRIVSEKDDELVNHLLNASCVLKELQGGMQNIAQIIMELLYPFEKEELMCFHYDVVRDLLKIKYDYRIGIRMFTTAGRAKSDTVERLNGFLLNVIEPIPIDGCNFDTEEVVIKKGMGSNIAEIMGCSRQNADVLIKRGNVIAIRNLDYVALQYIERKYGVYDI